MKVSEVIKELQGIQVEYGDIDVVLSTHIPQNRDPSQTLWSYEAMFFRLDKRDDKDELAISSFPY